MRKRNSSHEQSYSRRHLHSTHTATTARGRRKNRRGLSSRGNTSWARRTNGRREQRRFNENNRASRGDTMGMPALHAPQPCPSNAMRCMPLHTPHPKHQQHRTNNSSISRSNPSPSPRNKPTPLQRRHKRQQHCLLVPLRRSPRRTRRCHARRRHRCLIRRHTPCPIPLTSTTKTPPATPTTTSLQFLFHSNIVFWDHHHEHHE
mmetsp:Transcript_1513/g.2150  ORF Transcript_1513/g.2150 Transcript_1513/m.2150 type:complete len:204 (+) Transcript_1513:310-921(+)